MVRDNFVRGVSSFGRLCCAPEDDCGTQLRKKNGQWLQFSLWPASICELFAVMYVVSNAPTRDVASAHDSRSTIPYPMFTAVVGGRPIETA